MPTASMATSAPSPLGEVRMTAAGSSVGVVDGDVGAELLGRLEPASARSMAMMWPGLNSRRQ